MTMENGTVIPATKGVRLHDLRHTAAVLWLTAGVHFIQAAKCLGHSSYVLTLTTYADYIPEEEAVNPATRTCCGSTEGRRRQPVWLRAISALGSSSAGG
jgi:hypothetical protein